MSEKQFRMPRAFAEEKWFPALLSGELSQGAGQLYIKEDNEFCCLGVAALVCGVAVDFMGDKGMIYSKHNPMSIQGEYDPNLTDEALNHGYPTELLWNGAYSLSAKLADLNDSGNNFEYIVNWVKENVELYD